MEFPHEGKIPATSSARTADRVIIDRVVKNYTRRTSRLVSPRLTSLCRVASCRDSREFARNDRVINNLRTHLPRITSSISVTPSEVENIFFPSLGASLLLFRDMSNRKVQEVCHDVFNLCVFSSLSTLLPSHKSIHPFLSIKNHVNSKRHQFCVAHGQCIKFKIFVDSKYLYSKYIYL